jgi:hypothetical protein
MVESTAVLFNAEQLSVHCEPLAEFVAAEEQDVLHAKPGWGWRLVAVCRSQEEASAWQAGGSGGGMSANGARQGAALRKVLSSS